MKLPQNAGEGVALTLCLAALTGSPQSQACYCNSLMRPHTVSHSAVLLVLSEDFPPITTVIKLAASNVVREALTKCQTEVGSAHDAPVGDESPSGF